MEGHIFFLGHEVLKCGKNLYNQASGFAYSRDIPGMFSLDKTTATVDYETDAVLNMPNHLSQYSKLSASWIWNK